MSTQTDEKVDLDVDLNAVVKCESKRGCDKAATYILITRMKGGCVHHDKFCDEHKTSMNNWLMDQLSHPFKRVVCKPHMSEYESHTWEPL